MAVPFILICGLHIEEVRAPVMSGVESTLVPLPELGVISVSGADAISFLQSQLTNDVAHLTADRMQLSGYCTPKGRLLATFHQWRIDDTVFLRTPRDVVSGIVKRLSMFILRAKVKVVDASDLWATQALLGNDSARVLLEAGFTVAPAPWTSASVDRVRVDRVLPTPSGMDRFLLTGPSESPPPLPAVARGPSNLWWFSEIEAAVPTVFAATQEKFVPQMLNLEVLGAVDFKKGCYPGQEIVARSQYLGKLKRRMNVAYVHDDDVLAGADVFHSDGAQPIGLVVMAARSPDGGSELLFEAPIDRLQSGSLHLRAGGPRLDLRPLPYTLFDPTE